MAKPSPRRIALDAFEIEIDGVTYHPHEGEWVDVTPRTSVAELQHQNLIRQLSVRMDAVKGEPDESAQVLGILDEAFEQLCTDLAKRGLDWNVTDDSGDPLPTPKGNPAAFKSLPAVELWWLLNAIQNGETPSAEKNVSNSSPTTSLDTEPTPSPTS